ncbi:MAG: sensor histidine kinase [Allosphingosinicella sp.]
MIATATRMIDYFVPPSAREESSNYMMYRTFVILHLLGPLLGHSVIVFLYQASTEIPWVFWFIEVNVCFFWLMPLLVRATGSLVLPATLSVQALVMLSLFGSFFYGGISSPFLPWLLNALLIGFFYLADRVRIVLTGVAVQLTLFATAHFFYDFPELVPLESLWLVNLLSILSALIYSTMVALYYENVMRESYALEEAAHEHRQRAEKLRRAMARAEHASHQKSIFLAKMNHELRTPLNAVIGYSEMLRDELVEGPGFEEKAADLDRINAAGRHLNALVSEVLDVSRIENDNLEVQNSEIDLLEMVEEAVATVAPLIQKNDNRLEVQIATSPGTIVADPLKLRQSILNLLSNSAKFTSKGTITLTVMRRQTPQGEVAMIEVRDTGIGISPEGLDKLFVNFSQAEASTSNRFGGTGLGLALTRRFCQSMGGGIEVESEVGVGSSFKIEIPVAPPIAEAVEKTKAGNLRKAASGR